MVVKAENSIYTEEVTEVDVYVRVSSEDQQERETIENQIEFAIKYCDLHKLTIREWYKDDGITGTIPLEDRPDGKRLIENAQAGKVKLLLIYNMKRLGRKARVTLDAVYQLEQHGVMIRSMTEPFDTGTPVGRFIITVLAGQAELDRDTTLEVMWHGANRAARKGKWLGGIVPYGYRVNSEGYLEVSEELIPGREDMTEASVIRLIYFLISEQKYSTIKIADYLNALSIPPAYVKDGRKVKRGKRKEKTAGIWSPGRIRNIIRSTTYKGLHIYGKRSKKKRELIEREVPAIVSEEVWNTAQQVLRDNQLEALKNAKRQYLLRGLIKCGACGLTYHGTAYKNKPYYTCGGKTAYKGKYKGKCYSKNVPAEWIEDLVWNECLNFIKNPGEALQELAKTMETKKSMKDTYQSEKQNITKSLNDKESEKQDILGLFRKKIINAVDVESQLQQIATEKSILEARLIELDQLIESEENMSKQFDTAEALLLDLREKIRNGETSFEIKREIVRVLVVGIMVHTSLGTEANKRSSKTATVNTRYAFNNSKVVTRTVVRAGIGARRAISKAAYAARLKYRIIARKFPDRFWTGSICTSKCRESSTRT